MSDSIELNTWLDVMGDEYLTSYVPSGGSTIKICVVDPDDRVPVVDRIYDYGNSLGYVVAKVDGEAVRLHMLEDIFFLIAQQIDWRTLARRAILRMANSYSTSGIDPSHGNIYEAIADLNSVTVDFLLKEIRPKIEQLIFRDPYMARDFRIVMMQMCLHERFEDDQSYGGRDLINWLTNNKESPINLKQFSINKSSINRTTAQDFLKSLSYFIRWVGLPGLILIIDNTRVFVHPNPRNGIRYYNRAQLMDHYEILRNFIDDIDQIIGIFTTVITDPEFLNANNDRFSRGYGIYDALRTRVMNDVHDRDLVNPIATLVRLYRR